MKEKTQVTSSKITGNLIATYIILSIIFTIVLRIVLLGIVENFGMEFLYNWPSFAKYIISLIIGFGISLLMLLLTCMDVFRKNTFDKREIPSILRNMAIFFLVLEVISFFLNDITLGLQYLLEKIVFYILMYILLKWQLYKNSI